jgi:hypothetical protein
MLLAQVHLLAHRLLDHARLNANAAVSHLTFADMQFLLGDRDDLVASAHASRIGPGLGHVWRSGHVLTSAHLRPRPAERSCQSVGQPGCRGAKATSPAAGGRGVVALPPFRAPGGLLLVEVQHAVIVQNVDHPVDLIIVTLHGNEGPAAAHAFGIGMGIGARHTVIFQIVDEVVGRRRVEADVATRKTGLLKAADDLAGFLLILIEACDGLRHVVHSCLALRGSPVPINRLSRRCLTTDAILNVGRTPSVQGRGHTGDRLGP